MKPLTRAELDQAGCGTPNCGHDHSTLFLNPACHLGAGVDAAYNKARGVLTLMCHKCQRPVGEIAVAGATRN